ncbi:MAG: Rrf2 family transcriptional regulator [Chlorobi bacterium]|nr:Rrf2 family transcriptional regulator [Chlorobiota bacterium]
MSNIVNLSEASSIAIHSMVLIAKSDKLLNVIKISELTSTSKHHVAKILQRLVKEDFLISHRGPSGGFALKANPNELNFLQIYESIEGKITIPECHMNKPVCPFDKCIMNNVVKNMTIRFRDYLESQYLSEYI